MTPLSNYSQSTHPVALILQNECFGKNYLSFLDYTCNYKRTSEIFVPSTKIHYHETKKSLA